MPTFPARNVGELRRLLNDNSIPDETPLSLWQQGYVGDGSLDTFVAPLARVRIKHRDAVNATPTGIVLEGAAP